MGNAQRYTHAIRPAHQRMLLGECHNGRLCCYKKAGDPHGERRVLELLSTQARDPGLRDLATLRLAGLKAGQGSLKEAIDIVRKSDPKGELAEPRAKLLQTWQEQLKSKKATQ
jgi:hypothetical protein